MARTELNPLTIALAKEDRDLFINRMRVSLYYMAVPLVLSFAAVDYFFTPKKVMHFLLARLLVVPISVSLYQLYRVRWIRKFYFQLPAHLFVIYLGVLNTYFAWQTGGEKSPYYAGLNLVGIAAFGFLPWKSSHMLLTALLLYGPYFVVSAATGNLDISYFIPHAAFMFSTIFMAAIVTHLAYQLRLAELKSRLALTEEVGRQERVIKEKTQEGVQLERLSSQFSPQVVYAIKNGQIAIDKRQRRELTCIFIDVENSTGRSLRLDHYLYIETLNDFFTSCVDIFLRHDVTISTYLGDGMLAFVNAPQSTDGHQLVAIKACLEILKQHQLRQPIYREKWRTEFNLRIGVNTGYASVGFFPNSKRGTYTAVGEPVNLAARLCSSAKKNSICVTKPFLKSIGQELENAIAEFQETAGSIKGFENEVFELFSIIPKNQENAVSDSKCPLCQNILSITSDLGKSFLVNCTQCAYSDIIDDPKNFLTGTKAS